MCEPLDSTRGGAAQLRERTEHRACAVNGAVNRAVDRRCERAERAVNGAVNAGESRGDRIGGAIWVGEIGRVDVRKASTSGDGAVDGAVAVTGGAVRARDLAAVEGGDRVELGHGLLARVGPTLDALGPPACVSMHRHACVCTCVQHGARVPFGRRLRMRMHTRVYSMGMHTPRVYSMRMHTRVYSMGMHSRVYSMCMHTRVYVHVYMHAPLGARVPFGRRLSRQRVSP